MFHNWPYGGVSWKGVGILKQPTDLFLQHQIIWQTKPEVVVETGTWRGGSALFYTEAGVEVHTVDMRRQVAAPADGVTYYTGKSTDPDIVSAISKACEGRRVMVVLDSDHHKQTVLDELDAYAHLVTSGCYLVVEDTTLFAGDGPTDALDEWWPYHPEFVPDRSITVTEHPGGYLIRQ